MTWQSKHWKHYGVQWIAYAVKNIANVLDVRSLACKIKGLNGRVPKTRKWTIAFDIEVEITSFVDVTNSLDDHTKCVHSS